MGLFLFFRSRPCIMKRKNTVSSSRRKNRQRYFAAPSSERRKLLSAALSSDLRKKYGVRSVPVRKDDEVTVVRGQHKVTGKVTSVYRRRWVIHIEKLTRDKPNGQSVPIGVHPSNCVINKLHLDKDREALLARKRAGAQKDKDKMDVQA